jgi:hypothetical protein
MKPALDFPCGFESKCCITFGFMHIHCMLDETLMHVVTFSTRFCSPVLCPDNYLRTGSESCFILVILFSGTKFHTQRKHRIDVKILKAYNSVFSEYFFPLNHLNLKNRRNPQPKVIGVDATDLLIYLLTELSPS